MQEFQRSFRIWDFRVSHDQLLLRSPKSASTPKNLDIAFVGVEYVELPTKMRDIKLCKAEVDEHKKIEQMLNKSVPLDQVFILETAERRYVIVAAAVKVFENELDIFESSLERF